MSHLAQVDWIKQKRFRTKLLPADIGADAHTKANRDNFSRDSIFQRSQFNADHLQCSTEQDWCFFVSSRA